MSIFEICDMLRSELFNNGYEYGFYMNGKKYKPDISSGFDNEYYQLSKTIYRVQPPYVTIREKTGTCVDATLVMKQFLDECDIPSKIWLLYERARNKVHTILTFAAEERIVYLELTPQSAKPWYGREIIYQSEQEFLKEFESADREITDVTDQIVIGEPPEFLLAKLQ